MELRVVWEIFDRSAPASPIHVGRGLADLGCDLFRRAVLLDAHAVGRAAFEAGELADGIVLDERGSGGTRRRNAAGSRFARHACCGWQHPQAGGLPRDPCERFLSIDILAGVERGDADRGVHVVGGADDDRIKIFVLQEFLIMSVTFAVGVLVMPVHLGFGTVRLVGIDIANGHKAYAFDTEKVAHVAFPLPAAADKAHHDFIIGRTTLLGTQVGERGQTKRGGSGD